MIKSAREAQILTVLRTQPRASVWELCAAIGGVSAVTVRRDIARLAELGMLRRMHGGAARLPETRSGSPPALPEGLNADAGAAAIADVDAIVLPPIEGRGAQALRLGARRRGIPFLAESAPQDGGTYLGPDNRAAGQDLGRAAADHLNGRLAQANILIVSLEALPNTRLRADGFLEGFGERFKGRFMHWRIDGRGVFRTALRASLDAFQAYPGTNVVFGVNDHSILAAIEAAERSGTEIAAFSIGGEGGHIFDALEENRALKACCGLFPEIVGSSAIDVVGRALAGGRMPMEVLTPHAVLTPQTLSQFYRRDADGWSL
ncbi:MAG: DeoR/GlpR family transcriptional regulator, partial [Methylobacteriaceae bacterium]|nr:DeoR/GlpR family transcriptional regulator [Methylobacteriaceae bacterium]